MQNFDADVDADVHENVTCKQSFKLMQIIYFTL